MSTANALICAALFYGFLVLIGRATIAICRHRSSRLESIAIAPVVGLAVLTLLSTYLVLLDIPLNAVSKNLALAIAILVPIFLTIRRVTSVETKEIGPGLEYLAPLGVTALLVALPFIIGGYEFAILRGNGTDAFNYVTMADALTRYQLDWILAQAKETLEFQSPNLSLAQDLLKTRWSTSALLALVSNAAGISPIEFEYAFTLTLMIVLFNALVGALSATSSLTRVTIWLPVVFVVGFWGQFTIDIRAFSQIVSLPILVTLIGWVLASDAGTHPNFRYGIPLTAILSAAVFFQYPEIVVAFLPGAGFLFLRRFWITNRKEWLSSKDIRDIVAVFSITLLLIAPLITFLIDFTFNQTRVLVVKSLGWENAYFTWLRNPLRGIWGAGINPGLGVYFDNAFEVIAFLVTLGLTLGVAARIAAPLSSRPRLQANLSETGVFLLAASGLIGAGALVVTDNFWAAGKVVSYFSFLIPVWMAIYISIGNTVLSTAPVFGVAHRVLVTSILGWIAIGIILAGTRVIHSARGSDFPNYILGHGEYREVNAGALAQLPYFNCPAGSAIAIFEPTVWGREFLTHLVEGRGLAAFTPGFARSRSTESSKRGMTVPVNCALAQRKYFDASSLPPMAPNTAEFFAAPPGEHFAALSAFEGGYGTELDRDTSTRYVWTGQQDVRLTLLAHASAYVVGLKLCPGSARGTSDPINVFVDVDGLRTSQLEVRDCIDLDLELVATNQMKSHQIRLTTTDPRHGPTLLGQDTRDLRLRVDVSRIYLKK